MSTELLKGISFIKVLAFSVLLVAAGALNLAAQNTASIQGTVKDQSGAVLAGAEVSATNVETGQTRTASSSASGDFHLPSLAVGTYDIHVGMTGFQSTVRKGITLTIGRDAVVDFSLQVGNVSEQVTVTGEAPLIETTTATVSGTVDQKQMRDIPLNARSFIELVPLQTGAVFAEAGSSSTSKGFGKKLSVSGTRYNTNLFLLDGTDINDAEGSAGSAAETLAGVETVREFRVITNAYDAEYGRHAGGVISAITKSGTNTFHGSLFEFLRNDKLDAAKWEDNAFNGGEKAAYKRNQFGGSLGGPVFKDRTFFFGSYEGLRQRLGQTRTSVVPGFFVRTTNISPVTRPFVNSYPTPNVQCRKNCLQAQNGVAYPFDSSDRTGQYSDAFTQPTTQNYWTARGDHRVSDSDAFFGRFTYDHADQFRPGPGGTGGIFNTGASISTSSRFLTLEETHIFSPVLIAKTNLSFTRTNLADVDTVLPGFTLPVFSFTGVTDEPGNIAVSGTGALSTWGGDTSTPQIHIQNTYQFREDFNFTKGQHAFKFGANMERFQVNQRSDFYPSGGFAFTSLQDFLDNKPSTANFTKPGSDNIRGWRQSLVGMYFQDDYKIRPSLTLNLGLRYEFMTVPKEANGKVATIRDITPAHLYTVLPNQTDVGALWQNPSHKNFAPRVGIAWSPLKSGKTSIRAGAGIFDDQLMFSAITTSGVRVPPFYSVAGMIQSNLSNLPTPVTIDFPFAYKTQSDLLVRNIGSKPQIDAFEFYVKQPTIYKYSFDVEQQIAPDTTLAVGYTGTRGIHLVRGNLLLNSTPATTINGNRFILLYQPVQALQNANWDRMRWRTTDGVSDYHALRVNLTKRFSHTFQIQTSYTYSKATDDSSTWTGSSDFGSADRRDYQVAKPHALAAFDVRNSFYTNYIYDLPGAKLGGIAGTIIGGWSMSGVIRLNSGYPVSLVADTPRTIIGNVTYQATYVDGNTLNLTPGGNQNPTHPQNPNQYYDQKQFSYPATNCLNLTGGSPCNSALPIGYFQGNLGRNTMISPGIMTFDWTMIKSTALPRLGESTKLEFRAEFFNLFNRPNFDIPNLSVYDRNGNLKPNAGQIMKAAQSARQIQFALRLAF